MKSTMNQELDAILDPKPKVTLDVSEILRKLEELRDLASSQVKQVLASAPKMSQHYYQSEILKMDISSRDKVILMDMLLNDSSVKGTEAQARCNMTKQEYNNGARSLLKQHITVKDKCGHYSINSRIF
jgi:hypothetical protein